MKPNPSITVAAKDLKPALTGLAKVISRHPATTAGGHVKFAANGTTNSTTITGAGEHVRLSLQVPAGARDKCEFLVPFADLKESAKGCGAGDYLVLEPEEDGKVTLTRESGGTRIPRTVNTIAAADFPEATRLSGKAFALDAHAREAITHAQACASKDPNRAVLQGPFIEGGNTVVGTDGRHLYRRNGMDLPAPESMILPELKALTWKGLETGDDWTMAANGKRFRLSGEGWELSGELVEGTYPNWKQVMPEDKDFTSSATFDDGALGALAKTVAGLPGGKRDNKPVGIRVAGGSVSFVAGEEEGGTATEVPIPQGTSEGKENTAYINRDYLLKAFRFGLNKVDIKDGLSPLRFRRSDSDGTDMIVMPVRVAAGTSPAPARKTEPKPETMKNGNNTNNNGHRHRGQPGDGEEEAAPLDAALDRIVHVKDLLREAASGLTELNTALRKAKADQKSAEKEIRAVKSTIRTLQKVEL